MATTAILYFCTKRGP